MPGPNGIITVKGSFELSDLCDKEFHKMVQNFGMMANNREPKGKVTSATTSVTKQLKENPVEPEVKKLRVQPSHPKKATGEEEKTSVIAIDGAVMNGAKELVGV
jgi:hypothetical protein